ncbi:PREDICTED: disease resistance protein RML1A-like [Ipomoea nil]|uniref:disease resistance protein RML1A-like n=1 Tax=Ipomoea nil TaxID=35883 RepID=UPI000900AB7D|nr:PREDICTED: disease resistance protein RML1A-like [Ipomoea nil]
MNVVKYPVGIDSRVKDIDNLLQSQTNDDMKMIEIFGMGGVGKKTLAKAIYNRSFQRFEGSCFITKIGSEVSRGRHEDLTRLQEKIVCEMLERKIHEINNVGRGKTLIKGILPSKKVHIVLDDIDQRNQLESLEGQRGWFGSSIIIVTITEVQLLSKLGAHEKYKGNMLGFDESLQLLGLNASDIPVPLEEYTVLEIYIVTVIIVSDLHYFKSIA